jgi:hypothetical protein
MGTFIDESKREQDIFTVLMLDHRAVLAMLEQITAPKELGEDEASLAGEEDEDEDLEDEGEEEVLDEDEDEDTGRMEAAVPEVAGESEGEDDPLAVFAEARLTLLAHAHAEEREVYDVLGRHHELELDIRKAREEHALVERLFDEIAALDEPDEDFIAKCQVLKDLIEHHVEEEEGPIFEEARGMVDAAQATEMARRFLAARERELVRLESAEGPEAGPRGAQRKATTARGGESRARGGKGDLAEASRKDLVERARQAGLHGYSQMTKAELIRALNRAQHH